MIEINFGEKVAAECRFSYQGTAGYFTFAFEIGTWLPPAFNTLDRWETTGLYITPGTNKVQTITFTINKVDGLVAGDIKDMNWEIGTGSKAAGNWKLITRLISEDVIKIVEAAAVFTNLSVIYKKG